MKFHTACYLTQLNKRPTEGKDELSKVFFICIDSKNLTWRDMQHLVVRTSDPAHLITNDWKTNGVGRKGTDIQLRLIYGLILFLCSSSAIECGALPIGEAMFIIPI